MKSELQSGRLPVLLDIFVDSARNPNFYALISIFPLSDNPGVNWFLAPVSQHYLKIGSRSHNDIGKRKTTMITVNHSLDYKIHEEIVEDMFKKIKGRNKRNICDE